MIMVYKSYVDNEHLSHRSFDPYLGSVPKNYFSWKLYCPSYIPRIQPEKLRRISGFLRLFTKY